ncbi:RRM_2 domain-containing protein [Cephalotus follicularis]|uniref:RRM_2 domain-containing protein n=1 Tax=Cephalotus follicularis TaxID=3775 RepID=A0A1Q3C1X2_CEPFO|nr:RRM_2 domain-containing protein [Cephalotus follicularis]
MVAHSSYLSLYLSLSLFPHIYSSLFIVQVLLLKVFTNNMSIFIARSRTISSLNPHATEFRPNNTRNFYYPPFTHHCFQPHSPLRYYQLDPSLYYLLSASLSPHTQYQHCTNPYPTEPVQQHLDHHFQVSEPASPPPVVSEEPHLLHEPEAKPEVVTQKDNQRGAKRGFRSGSFRKRNSDGKEGFQGSQCHGYRQVRRGGESYCYRNVGAPSRYPRQQKSWRGCKQEVVPVQPDGDDTTVMIKNIPNKYSREQLLEFLDNHCTKENDEIANDQESNVSAFDFLYLPMDFDSGMNKGYAFVNFTDPKAVWKLHIATLNQAWPHYCQSHKRCEIASARLQGKEELVKHFKGMVFPCEAYQPVSFSPARDGSKELVNQSNVGVIKGNWQAQKSNHI